MASSYARQRKETDNGMQPGYVIQNQYSDGQPTNEGGRLLLENTRFGRQFGLSCNVHGNDSSSLNYLTTFIIGLY